MRRARRSPEWLKCLWIRVEGRRTPHGGDRDLTAFLLSTNLGCDIKPSGVRWLNLYKRCWSLALKIFWGQLFKKVPPREMNFIELNCWEPDWFHDQSEWARLCRGNKHSLNLSSLRKEKCFNSCPHSVSTTGQHENFTYSCWLGILLMESLSSRASLVVAVLRESSGKVLHW